MVDSKVIKRHGVYIDSLEQIGVKTELIVCKFVGLIVSEDDFGRVKR